MPPKPPILTYVALILVLTTQIANPAPNDSIVTEIGSTVLIDGSVQASNSLQANQFFELVEISTPSTPASNHARLFLTPGTGSKQQLSIIFDDGTTARVASN